MPAQDADPRSQVELLRKVLQKRRRGETGEMNALNSAANSERVRALLESLDRVEAARQRVLAEPEDADDLLDSAGLTLDGYELLRPIGIGGFGVIRQARKLSDDTLVAVKFLKRWKHADESDRRRFLREVAIQQELRHPHIVSILESGRTGDGVDYFVMPYIDGRPLNPGALAQTLDLGSKLSLFRSICSAVAAAHERKIIHRDIRPANIVIDRAGQPHLIDFGLAVDSRSRSLRRSIHTTGKNLGNFLWSSYEQVAGVKELTPASDVFSLGVILHQLLLDGRFPPDVLRVMETVLDQPGTRIERQVPLAYAPTLREDLRRILAKCLVRDPMERFADAGELGVAIDAAMAYVPLQPRRVNMRWIGLFVLLVVAGGVTTHYAFKAKPVSRPFDKFGKPPIVLVSPGGVRTTMHYIGAGTFRMGIANRSDTLPDEQPRSVTIGKGFYISNFEVTQSLYRSLMDSNPSRFQSDVLPVERVTYHDAVEFCRRLSQREGRTYRLPTEQEWEYACRAGTETNFSFGDDGRLMLRYANIADLSNTEDDMNFRSAWNDGQPRTARVGMFLSNNWQLHDMHGNVWEWCQAPYVANFEDASTKLDGYACVKGGSWWDDPMTCRSSNRNPQKLDAKTSTIGFRIVSEE